MKVLLSFMRWKLRNEIKKKRRFEKLNWMEENEENKIFEIKKILEPFQKMTTA